MVLRQFKVCELMSGPEHISVTLFLGMLAGVNKLTYIAEYVPMPNPCTLKESCVSFYVFAARVYVD